MITQTDIEKYFVAEKQQALLFILLGVAALAGAIICWAIVKTTLCKGIAVPLAIFGLLLIVVCGAIYNKSDEQRVSNVYALGMNPDQLRTREWPRMQAVESQYAIYFSIEILLLAAGIILLFLFAHKPQSAFWYGFGWALAGMAALMLAGELFSAQRAGVYTTHLKTLLEQ